MCLIGFAFQAHAELPLVLAANRDERHSRAAAAAAFWDDAPELPDTGIGLGLERRISAPFIEGERYGTRAATIVTIDRAACIAFDERRFGPGGDYVGGTRYRIEADGRW
jgi:uncharacterized protein with NRDE domain